MFDLRKAFLYIASYNHTKEIEEAQRRLDESVKITEGTGEVRRRVAQAYEEFVEALRQ